MDVRKAETCQGGGDISRSLARVKHFVLIVCFMTKSLKVLVVD